MKVRLLDIASVIRSKNAGPGELTLDIIFSSPEWFDRVAGAGVISKALIASLYGQHEDDVLGIIPFAPASAIKATLRRPIASGGIGDTDIYGAQQHAPLLDLQLDIDPEN